jgi:signal transduction histidine kinase
VLESIVEHAAQVLDSNSAWLYLSDQDPDEFRCEFSFGENGEAVGTVLSSGEGVLGEIVRQESSLIIPDFQAWPGEISLLDREKIHTLMGAPVLSEGEIKGVLLLSRQTESSSYTSNDLELLEIFAGQVGTSLENEILNKDERFRLEVLEALHEASIRLTSSLELQPVLDEILNQALALIEADDAHIFLFDGEKLSFGAARWTDERRSEPYSEPREDGITYTVARTGQSIVTEDVNKHPLFKEWMWGGAIASFPLRIGEQVVGVMNIAFENPHVFDTGELRVLELFALQAAIALQNARKLHESARRLAQLSALQQVAKVINSRLEMQILLEEISYQVLQVLGYEIVEIYLVEGDVLRLRSAQGSGEKPGHTVQFSQGIIGRVASTNTPAFVPDVTQDPDYVVGFPSSKSEIVVPLSKGEIVIGVINVESPARGGLDESDLRLLMLLADQVLVAIENATLYDRLRSHTSELEQTVQERTAALAEALEDARGAERVKTQFVADVSHELRTPLANMRLYLELLNFGNPARTQEYLDTLTRETDRLVILIEDLLAISRIDTGTSSPNLKEERLNSVVHSLIEDRQRLLSERSLEVDVSFDENSPEIMIDEKMITQAVSLILTNAMQYSKPGGLIRIKTETQQIDNHEWVLLTIADTGIGIPPEELGRVFERFYRGRASRLLSVPGTGLGLAITKEILDRHGGRITVQSKVDVGSEFTIWLPVDGS